MDGIQKPRTFNFQPVIVKPNPVVLAIGAVGAALLIGLALLGG